MPSAGLWERTGIPWIVDGLCVANQDFHWRLEYAVVRYSSDGKVLGRRIEEKALAHCTDSHLWSQGQVDSQSSPPPTGKLQTSTRHIFYIFCQQKTSESVHGWQASELPTHDYSAQPMQVDGLQRQRIAWNDFPIKEEHLNDPFTAIIHCQYRLQLPELLHPAPFRIMPHCPYQDWTIIVLHVQPVHGSNQQHV